MDRMDRAALAWASATEAAELVRTGTVTAVELVEACLARIEEADGEVQAWAFLDPAYALAQAHAADAFRLAGHATGPLHGVPVGVKDIFDTADMPTEHGSVLHAGRTPARDASAVAGLRAAGAIVLGKTVTTELAGRTPGKTRNPHHAGHTPGGSSSGSAAAVAAGMVPLALGSQTGGSTIRPAAYCGVFGFKPTHGLIPRHGMLRLSRTLDHVGVFARTLDDIALLAEALVGYDERDPDSRPRAPIPFRVVAAEPPPLPPTLALVKTEAWARVDADAREAFGELAERLGARLEEVELPGLDGVAEAQALVADAERAASLAAEWARGRDTLSPGLRERIERGRAVTALAYQEALARIPVLNEGLDELFTQRYDAIVTPAAAGTAPAGLDSTGDPVFCVPWTLCGLPALSVPLMQGANGLPLGVQLVGRRLGDARLLRTARWLVETLAG